MFDDPFVGEIRMFGGNFAPRGWAMCNGQTLPINQNTALFSLLGITYGGDGVTTFALPNLQGMAPMNYGPGPGLTARDLGETAGTPTVTLTAATMAAHSHAYNGENANPASTSPAAGYPATTRALTAYTAPGASGLQTAAMSTAAIAGTGGNQPHNNMQPYLAVTFIIALQGVFPSRP